MKAVALMRYLAISDPESLIDVELEKPIPSGHDLLIRIEAIGMNPIDTKVRAPKDRVEKTPRVLGWDTSGVVEPLGQDLPPSAPGAT
jgi:NADPH:quinone reductase-like Zn-dependent oxidoreductase